MSTSDKLDNCQFCEDFIGTDKSSQILHLHEKHDDLVDLCNHKCLKCHVKFEDSEELLKHLLFINGNDQCSLCFSAKQDHDHYRTCHRDYVEQHWGKCEVCDGYFQLKYSRFHQHCSVVRKARKRKPNHVPVLQWPRMSLIPSPRTILKPKKKIANNFLKK